MRKIASLALAAALAASPASAKNWAPRDECASLEGSEEFRRALTTAVVNRNKQMLLGLFDKHVHLDFGGGSGVDELARRLDDPNYDLWTALDQLLVLGCAADGANGMTLPWYFAQDMGEVDPYGAMVVLGDKVPVYGTVQPRAPKLYLDWALVTRQSYLEATREDGTEPYIGVIMADGKRGIIDRTKVRSLIDYRLYAARDADGWTITSFIAGD